ncbi:hypothetical protein P691DRAFT_792642 [Macrolepiota fuliginosa MF-IS2]|uniref:Uncharacterized protein n=1 Tax=Macrolepiota fuliginosa MF-IS2 TaxID=1400762 RepID=A0A9P5WXX5_9AGAR|nr:hypothetical protein P691DRAFT_792642 [Macrolepiota fuliginosa MF-IS2]
MLMATSNASDTTYMLVIEALKEFFPHHTLLSHYQVKNCLHDLTGVTKILHNMCPETWIAFTGPMKDHDICSTCDLMKGKKVPACTFTTIPIGPVLQALYAGPQTAEALYYHKWKTQDMLHSLVPGSTLPPTYDDFFCGTDYLLLHSEGNIQQDNICLMLSLDSAQLYEHWASDCWMHVWVIMDIAPDQQYKKCYIIPGGFIPGPNKPGNIESFLFPGLHHISALQQEGSQHFGDIFQQAMSGPPIIQLRS